MIQFIKYFLTGATAAAVDFVIFAAIVKLVGWPWFIAATISFVVATLVNYVISIKHVFTSGVRFQKRDEIVLTFAVSAVGLAVNQSILFLLIHAGVAVLLAKIGATGVVFMWNYTVRYRFVFKDVSGSTRK